ncbi:DNA processing protein [Limimonas halophila]|uniref:DNA processing protein n=1 Tax=Limimonas halophila TaxID=1082479 RepID=A0A1G7P660_9PROT|nr:DNA-processing protein DprA [Limimonas halophila]SDF81743.1 DNA processing protein [Limimonas halophila]
MPLRPPANRDELRAWLRLIRSENVGPVTFRDLLTRFGDAQAALDALPELAKRGGSKRAIKVGSKAAAERELAALHELGADILPLGSAAYPARLAAVPDAPPLLFARGNTQLLERPAVAMVGARNASANGRKQAREIAGELARQGMLVVSGLARGIDAAAHTGSLADGTAAVLAGGLDVIYPPEHDELYAEIGERGLLLAENAPGVQPQHRHFPRRNRLISGIAVGTVVVEASPKSGSLITARFAGEQGREVMAVPGSPADGRARGCNRLLKQGAALVENARDVLDALADDLRREPEEPEPMAYATGSALPDALDAEDLESARAAVLELLGATPVAVDDLIRECQLSPPVVATAILELELAGRCQRHPGNRVALYQEDASRTP